MADHRHRYTELYVVGPSSTGKTTLCNAVSQSLKLHSWCYITEVARQIMKRRGFTRGDVGKMEMQIAIMLAQLEREAEVCERARNAGEALILSDRSGVDPIIYAVLTAKDEHQAQQKKNLLIGHPTFQNALKRYRRAKFLLLRPVPEWLVDDGVRSLEQHARSFHLFRAVLAELGISYREIGEDVKDLTERTNWVKEWVTTSLAHPNL
ncbi:AAA domain-containing protein [Boletus coccyginus]|nr:AAA domain-containing protein [Boletus coccyginus]